MQRILSTVLMALVLAPLAYAQDAMQSKIKSVRANLGAAAGEERSTVRNGRVQDFEKGSIYWTAENGARFVTGDVLAKYKDLGAEGGALGYPVSEERSTPEGIRQTFEHGFIRTTRTGEVQVKILDGATLSENSLTIAEIGRIKLAVDDSGLLVFQVVKAPQTFLSCACQLKPSPDAQRLGFCTVTLSKDKKMATCKPQDCNGSCEFGIVDR
jgi:LGFP repeat-containing protein